MKTITKNDLHTFLKTTTMRRFHNRRNALCETLLTIIEPYAEKGISNVDEELDFCSTIEEALDAGMMLNAEQRVAVTCLIYDALEFQSFWQG